MGTPAEARGDFCSGLSPLGHVETLIEESEAARARTRPVAESAEIPGLKPGNTPGVIDPLDGLIVAVFRDGFAPKRGLFGTT
jgi:hypothetical protein